MLVSHMRAAAKAHANKAALAREARIDLPALYRFANNKAGLSLPALDRLFAALGLSLAPSRERAASEGVSRETPGVQPPNPPTQLAPAHPRPRLDPRAAAKLAR